MFRASLCSQLLDETSIARRFFRSINISQLLLQANFYKTAGFPCVDLLQVLSYLIFTGKNLWQLLDSEDLPDAFPARDTFYRFLNSPRFNWRRLLLSISCRVLRRGLQGLAPASSKVLIVDDSVYSRSRSKHVELLAWVYDHVEKVHVRGFRLLTLGWSDGHTFLPLCFSPLSSAKPEKRIQDIDPRVDKRTVGYRRRKEATRKASEVLLDLLDEALRAGAHASYLLFDSWFAFPCTIRAVHRRGLHVVCMLKALPNVRFLYEGRLLNLRELYQIVRKRRGRAKIVASVVVGVRTAEEPDPLQARLVFVRDRSNDGKWLCLLSTDPRMTPEEIIRVYGKRWDIEVFFKMCKSYLALAKEFQGRSYDMMFAHTTIVCLRYIMLALQARSGKDARTFGRLFMATIDELQEITFAQSIIFVLDLLKAAIKDVLCITDGQMRTVFARFFDSLSPQLRQCLRMPALQLPDCAQ